MPFSPQVIQTCDREKQADSTSSRAVCLYFLRGKWQCLFFFFFFKSKMSLTKSSVDSCQVKSIVLGSQMDTRMYKSLPFLLPRSFQLRCWDTGGKHEYMNVKVIAEVTDHLKRGDFHCFLFNNYLIIRCPGVYDKCPRWSQSLSLTTHIFSLLGVYPWKIKQFPGRELLGNIKLAPYLQPHFSLP